MGFASSSDKARIEPQLRRARVGSVCIKALTTASQLAEETDDTHFKNILANPQHVLHRLLPSRTHHSYKLRPRRHDCCLTVYSLSPTPETSLLDSRLKTYAFVYINLF